MWTTAGEVETFYHKVSVVTENGDLNSSGVQQLRYRNMSCHYRCKDKTVQEEKLAHGRNNAFFMTTFLIKVTEVNYCFSVAINRGRNVNVGKTLAMVFDK